MAFNDPFFASMNIGIDNGECTFDDLGLLLGLFNLGRPPAIGSRGVPYGTSQ